MRSIPANLLAHLQLPASSTAICWLIEKRDGTAIRGTDHDRDLIVPSGADGLGGTYLAGSNVTGSDVRSTADMSVDNLDVTGAVAAADVIDVSVADIESGILDRAPVTVFLINWQTPADGRYIIRRGYLGQITRNSDGQFQTEVRGLVQLLSQTIVRTFSERCNVVRFGDTRCGFNVSGATITGTVTAVTSRRRFDATLSLPSPAPAWNYTGGLLTMTSGAADGFAREIKRDAVGDVVGALELWDELPDDVEIGDEFTVSPGCDRQLATCRDTFDNLDNFRGWGVFIPGIAAITRGPES
jgi:uncharacterized phage protein (TIGR02218 family)